MKKQYPFARMLQRIEYDAVPLTLKEFIKWILENNPKELFHRHYAGDIPCYFITSINGEGAYYYANAWADKEPKFRTWAKFYNELKLQGLEHFNIHLQTPPTP